METPLSDVLVLAHAQEGGTEFIIASGELEAVLRDVLAGAAAAWPDIELSSRAYFRFLARHVPRDGRHVIGALDTLKTADMYLAAACLERIPAALEVFERQFLSMTSPVLARVRVSLDVIDEAKQVLRHRFFVGAGNAGPKMAEYSGVGPLHAWVKVAIARAALRVARAPKHRVDADDAVLRAIPAPMNDLEVDYLKRLYGASAGEAVRVAFTRLAVRDRNLLRQYYSLGLGIDQLGAFYRVHRATAARWVLNARQELVARTRTELEQQLNIDREDLSSVLRLLQSQLEDVMRSVLATPDSSPR